jgi:hypothetical protein
MDRLKRIMKSAMDDRSSRFMLGTIALGVVVALLAGTLIGYKLDNSKSTSTAKKATTATKGKKKKTTKKGSGKAVAHPLLLGSVVASRPAKISVVSTTKQRVPLLIGPRTIAEAAGAATAASIVVGAKVLYAPGATGTTSAAEVLVLPSTSGLGTKVTAVSPGVSMTLNGTAVVRTTGATVLRTAPANRRSIPVGTKVAVGYFSVRGKNGAVEVALLPATSKL